MNDKKKSKFGTEIIRIRTQLIRIIYIKTPIVLFVFIAYNLSL